MKKKLFQRNVFSLLRVKDCVLKEESALVYGEIVAFGTLYSVNR